MNNKFDKKIYMENFQHKKIKNADILKNTEYKSQVINFSNTSIIRNNNVEVNKNFNVLKSSYINN